VETTQHALERIAHLSLVQRRHLLGELLRRRLEQPQRFPLSFAQERVWLFERLHPNSAVYNIPLVMRLPGIVDRAALNRALDEILRRHEVLRATFADVDGVPMQEVRPAEPLSVPVSDLSDLPDPQRHASAAQLADDEARGSFDLVRGPLIRARLVRLAVHEHWLLITMHHLVSDGWSLGILVRELAAVYDAFIHGHPSPLPDLRFQFFDYVAWQREWLVGDNLRRLETYWKNQLAGAPSVLDLPTDYARPATQSFSGALHEFILPADLAGGVMECARTERVTLFVFLLAAYATLLYRYTGQDDTVIGVPMAGRVRTEFEPLIGFFVNNLALRLDLSGNLTFAGLCRRVNDTVLEAHDHQAYPFDRLIALVGADRRHDRTPVYQVVFNLQNNPTWDSLAIEDLGTSAMPQSHSGTAKWDLNLTMAGNASGMIASIEYDKQIFAAASVAQMAARFSQILAAVQRNTALTLLDIPLDGAGGVRSASPDIESAGDFDFGT
jgi:hypothetical protein